MTLHALYRRAAAAQRDYRRICARVTALDLRIMRLVDSGRDAHEWTERKKRVLLVALYRRAFFETARFEAKDRMLFDPYEEKVKREIESRFAEISAARRKGMS